VKLPSKPSIPFNRFSINLGNLLGQIMTPHMTESVSLVAVCASEMGPTRAATLTSTFLRSCHTKSVVVIGIAGALDSELRLGDILIPNEVYAYLENSAAQDSKGRWKLAVSGKHFTADAHLLNQTRQLAGKAPGLRRNWETRAKRRLTTILGEDNVAKALKAEIGRAKPQIFAGDHHLATGPTVGKSNAFAKWLRSENRKAAAMEMETASVFDAVETEIDQPRRLAIRGISDFADSRKSKVEKSYRGKFREICLLNAYDCFLILVEAGVFADTTAKDD
jgi:nucleoside phosphorylase